jgi:hypothetical protein
VPNSNAAFLKICNCLALVFTLWWKSCFFTCDPPPIPLVVCASVRVLLFIS